LISVRLIGGNITSDKTAEAKEWLKNQPLSFIENKGQFTDSEGKPAKDVLFKASSGNLDIYITTRGLSYVFIKQEEKPEGKTGSGFKDEMPGKRAKGNRKTSYYRLDMNLEGSTIGKEEKLLKSYPASKVLQITSIPIAPKAFTGYKSLVKSPSRIFTTASTG